MSIIVPIYKQIYNLIDSHLPKRIYKATRERLALLTVGTIRAESASPAKIAEAVKELGLSEATIPSIERRIRRIENDPQVDDKICFHPFARERLLIGHPNELLLIIDPTTQDDRVVMVTVAVWYRGRSLPLVWTVWPANVPLEGDRFWTRIEDLLKSVAQILPKHVPVTWLADRAFGTPAFTDLLIARGWHYVVRAQGSTRCQDQRGKERQIKHLIYLKGQKAKIRGLAFKKHGWRTVSIVVYWGKRHSEPLCLVSDLRPRWSLIHLYRRRYPIEATFRDYKSAGWHWEQGQVVDLEHIKRLLVGMAFATWIALFVGTRVATELLAQPPTGRRRTVPWEGKRSLFSLGLQRLQELLTRASPVHMCWQLTDWNMPNWQSQIHFHHARAFIFGARNGT